MASPGYGSLGNDPSADPLYGYFQAVAGENGQIKAIELQQCLTSSGISGTYKPFALEPCKLMIQMLDRDFSGEMGFNEFKELWAVLNQWKTTFMTYDTDRSGTVEPSEFHQVLQAFGYNLSPQALNIIVKRYDYGADGRITFDDFVGACVRLKGLTDHFKRRDTARNGQATISYDDFVQVAMFH